MKTTACLVVLIFATSGCSGKGDAVAALVALGSALTVVQLARAQAETQPKECTTFCEVCTFPCGNSCVPYGTLCYDPPGSACWQGGERLSDKPPQITHEEQCPSQLGIMVPIQD